MLESLQVSLEEYAEDAMSAEDWGGGESIDVELSQGVLTLDLGGRRGVFVINKQAPNRQIWLSSPVTGPARFEFDDGARQWVHVREPGAPGGRPPGPRAAAMAMAAGSSPMPSPMATATAAAEGKSIYRTSLVTMTSTSRQKISEEVQIELELQDMAA